MENVLQRDTVHNQEFSNENLSLM